LGLRNLLANAKRRLSCLKSDATIVCIRSHVLLQHDTLHARHTEQPKDHQHDHRNKKRCTTLAIGE
jgi:hypothetical protein